MREGERERATREILLFAQALFCAKLFGHFVLLKLLLENSDERESEQEWVQESECKRLREIRRYCSQQGNYFDFYELSGRFRESGYFCFTLSMDRLLKVVIDLDSHR